MRETVISGAEVVTLTPTRRELGMSSALADLDAGDVEQEVNLRGASYGFARSMGGPVCQAVLDVLAKNGYGGDGEPVIVDVYAHRVMARSIPVCDGVGWRSLAGDVSSDRRFVVCAIGDVAMPEFVGGSVEVIAGEDLDEQLERVATVSIREGMVTELGAGDLICDPVAFKDGWRCVVVARLGDGRPTQDKVVPWSTLVLRGV